MKPNSLLASLVAPAALVALGVLTSGCTVDKKKVEGSITDEFKSKGIKLKSVDCPANQKAKKGETFDCKAETDDGDKLTIHVTLNDNMGSLEWKLDGKILEEAKVGHSLEKAIDDKAHVKADVTCPDKTIVLLSGKSFTCDATIDGKSKKVDITLGEDDNYTWKIQ
jgi:Domain of unknown function (DUF4333)